ncbi:alpha/beta hydrolase fold domain-containing protein [Bizionia sp.]|uniref:alpha/beta hydrolase fold domain-containing protein n=1 Tax=Bizionia sp. TaxID=1954480 RepID=UPI003A94CF0C
MLFIMKTIHSLLLCSLTVLLVFSCDSDDETTQGSNLNAAAYYEKLNVSYGNSIHQKFDMYLPANRTLDTNVMILVHGGGWSAGDKSDMNGFRDFIKNEFPNMGIVNMNYRLADANNQPYPMQINDITAVINYLKNEREFYVIDDDFAFIGVSAGAHLALLWSYAFDTGSDIDMVCSIVGPTNLADPAYLNNTNPELQALLDLYGLDASIEFLEEVSPYHRATASAPPTTLFYGGMDPLIPVSQGTDMHAKLDNLGVTNEFTLYPNAGHGWIGLELLDSTIKLKAFMQTHFD